MRQIHRICLGLEAAQLAAGLVTLGMGYLTKAPDTSRLLHFYAAMAYIFIAIFAHVVVFFVVSALSRNIRLAYTKNPSNVSSWLVAATARLKTKLLPALLIHALFMALGATSNRYHHLAAWGALASGALTALAVAWVLKRNASYVMSFVTTGGFAEAPNRNV